MLNRGAERRRYGRIRLDVPLAGRLGEIRVRVLELSAVGFLVANETRVTPGDRKPFAFRWNETTVDFGCQVVRSTVIRLAKGAGDKSLYHTGLRITEVSPESFEVLREVLAERIVRAIEEQKANARGIPPHVAYMHQPEKGDLLRRCELVDGVWRKSETVRTNQPASGFTISAEVSPHYVDLLCHTWEETTDEGRRLTQLLAELSISRAEGIPTRRYVP